MVSSGPTTLSTSGSAPLQVIPNQTGMCFKEGFLVNGSTAGTYSIDGVNYTPLPAGTSIPLPNGMYLAGVWVQGSGMTGVFCVIQ